ncbi:hypothetical protein AAIG96_33335, partial [Pseudomonas aeruginosa]
QKSVRMTVESVSGCSWNECPDQRGITVRMRVEWVSESAWNPHPSRQAHHHSEPDSASHGATRHAWRTTKKAPTKGAFMKGIFRGISFSL